MQQPAAQLTPHREIHVELNIVRDNGEIEMFNAYRVQHDNSRGPFKGGFRFSPQVTMDEVRRCAPGSAHHLPMHAQLPSGASCCVAASATAERCRAGMSTQTEAACVQQSAAAPAALNELKQQQLAMTARPRHLRECSRRLACCNVWI